MMPVRKLVVYLVGAIAVFAILAMLFREATIWVIVGLVLSCVLIDGLIEGRLSFGRGNAKRFYRRDESPTAFWCIAAFYCAIILALISVTIFGESRRPHKSKQISNRASKLVPGRSLF